MDYLQVDVKLQTLSFRTCFRQWKKVTVKAMNGKLKAQLKSS
jgi:hypothetical protein